MRTGPEADHYPPANDEVKNEWSYSTTPKCLHGVHINSPTITRKILADNIQMHLNNMEGRGLD